MTAQLPLPVAPGVPIGRAASLVEDADGGRVFINGQLCFAWDAGDTAIRRLAAVQLVRIKAAWGYQVAAAFGVNEFTLYRWVRAVAAGGPAALVPGRRGPKGPSKLTGGAVAEIVERRAAGQSIAAVAAAVGVSERSVSTAVAGAQAGSGTAVAGPVADAVTGSTVEAVSDADTDTDADAESAAVDATGDAVTGTTGEAVSDTEGAVAVAVTDPLFGLTDVAVSDTDTEGAAVDAGAAAAHRIEVGTAGSTVEAVPDADAEGAVADDPVTGSTGGAVSGTDNETDIDCAVVEHADAAAAQQVEVGTAGSTVEAVSDADADTDAEGAPVDATADVVTGSTDEAVSEVVRGAISLEVQITRNEHDTDIDCAVVDVVDTAAAQRIEAIPGAAAEGVVVDHAVAVPRADVPVAGDAGGGAGGLPVLPGPVDRSGERVAARWGLLPFASPVFAPAARVPLAGLFLAVPALTATGLLDSARQVYGGVPAGFYGLDSMLTDAVFRALLGQSRAEGATRVNPTDLGRILGLDRAPEVKTVRRKTGLLAARGKADELLTMQARRHAADHPEAMSVLYVDGHVRTYHGTRKIQKTHVSRLRFPAPATVETWVADAQGAPVWVVMAEPGASLAGEIRRLLPDIRGIVGDDRRVLVGFDRGGWSPALFDEMIKAGFDVLTWRKGPAPDVDTESFAEHTHTDEHGITRVFQLADTTVTLPLDETDPDAGTVTLRQVSKLDPDTGRQVHILTSRTDLTAAQVCFRMGARWREENYFRYGRIHFALDAHECYAATDDDPDRSVPNPAKKTAHRAVQAARSRLTRAETRRDEQLLALRSPAPGTSTVLTNQLHDQLHDPVRAARADLDAAVAAHRATPTRLPLGEVRPGQQVLDTETKLLTHAIRMAAFNTQTMLARTITTSTGYAKARTEAHALVRTALAGTGDISPAPGMLHIRLDPLHTPRATAAIAELCAVLTDAGAVFPGTDLKMHYSVKPHR